MSATASTTIPDDDGLLRVTVTRAGEEVTREVDVVRAHDDLADAGGRAAGKGNSALWDEYHAWAEGLGFPGLSTHGVGKLVRAVVDAYGALLGKSEAGPTGTPG